MVRTSQRKRGTLTVLRNVVWAFLLVALPVGAQTQFTSALAIADSPADTRPDNSKIEVKPQPPASSERLFYAMPNYLTVQPTWKVQPLSAAKKFELVARNTYDYVEFPWYAMQASIRQAHDSQPEYGQGAEGYAKRYALTFADCTVQGFMVGAVMPSLLRQDPRFYREGRGRPTRFRLRYAMTRIFVTRGDSGRPEFNYSEVLGGALAAGISNYGYHPMSDHNLENVAIGWGTQMAFHTFSLAMKEFWPDIRMKMSGELR